MQQSVPPDREPPSFLRRDDGSTIAYRRLPGSSPGVVFLPGFHSDMTGTKATHLERWCRRRGNAYLRFDYQGHGESSGRFRDGTIGRWAADAVAVLDELTEGPQVLVGSSMGGWLMLLVALARPQRVAALVGLAAAPDFTAGIPALLSAEQRAELKEHGAVDLPDCYGGDPYPITRQLIEEGAGHCLLEDEIPLDCPVRLIQGMRDEDVPWNTALRLAERLRSTNVEVTLVKDGDHRLSTERDLARLESVVEQAVGGLPAKP